MDYRTIKMRCEAGSKGGGTAGEFADIALRLLTRCMQLENEKAQLSQLTLFGDVKPTKTPIGT